MWFGRENLLYDLDDLSEEDPLTQIESLSLLIANRLVRGEDIELFESRFIRDIVNRYSNDFSSTNIRSVKNTTKSDLHLTFKGLAELLNDLHIGSVDKNIDKSIFDNYRNQRSNLDHSNLHNQFNYEQFFLKNGSLRPGSFGLKSNPNEINKNCLDYSFYLKHIRKFQKNLNKADLKITEHDILQLAPIFLQQIVSKSCERELDDSAHDHKHEHNHKHDHHHDHDHDHDHDHEVESSNKPFKVNESVILINKDGNFLILIEQN